jgi:hypothetical protein
MKRNLKLAACAAALFSAGHFLAIAATPPTTDLTLWLKADAGVTLNGATVSQWDDQSPLAHHAYQSAAASQPALVTTAIGAQALRFDGLNDFMSFTNDINNLWGITIFLVANNTNPSQNGGGGLSNSPAIFWEESISWGWVYLSPFQGNVTWRFGTGDSATSTNGLYTRPVSIGAGYSLTTLKKDWDGPDPLETLYVNGSSVLVLKANSTQTTGVRPDGMLGGRPGSYFAGDILEVLVYNTALSDVARAEVESYLTAKYLANAQPTVVITGPDPNGTYTAATNLTITADAVDDGSVTNVEFFVNGVSIGSDGTVPFGVPWNNVAGGSYILTAKATDNLGAWNVSGKHVVRVNYATATEGPLMSGLSLWYKADAGVTATSGKVSVWADQSGFERHATQTSAAAQPTTVTAGNGKPAINFDGLGNYMDFTCPINGLSQLTVFAVANNTSPQGPWASGTDAPAVFWMEDDINSWGSVALGTYQDCASWIIGTGVAQSQPNYPGPAHWRPASIDVQYSRVAMVKNGPSESLYVEGVLVTNRTDKAATIAYITDSGRLGRGYAGPYRRGETLEVLVYTNALSGEQITNVDTYLTAKYWSKAQPVVTIDTPANNTRVISPANVTITATPSDSDGTISQVEFFDSGTLVRTLTSAPWTITLNNVAPGRHMLRAKVTDNEGLFNYSKSVQVFCQPASGWACVENFNNLSLGPIVYQGDWLGIYGRDTVAMEPDWPVGANTNNPVGRCISGNQALTVPLLIPQGTTATLFFRYLDTTYGRERMLFGLSDQANPLNPSLADYEVQVGKWMNGTANNMYLVNHEGSVPNYNLHGIDWDTWYKIWIVVDNAADTFKVYMQGKELTTPTLLDMNVGGATSFAFRNGTAANDLVRFMIKSEAHTGTQWYDGEWLDDIYLAIGENLSDPTIPPPPSLSIRRSGDNVIVSWPASATGYNLGSTASLSTPDWSAVGQTPTPVGDQLTVTLPVSEAPKYLRLTK